MANYKLILEDDFKDEFTLIAIHCSEDPYKMAYILNRQLSLQLQRKRTDLDFSKKGLEITFPWYEFEDQLDYTYYDLLANKCKTIAARTVASGGLFGADDSEEIIIEYLIPELKTVDFLMKISSDFEDVYIRKLLHDINDINQVISAYAVEVENLKSKNNLIFD
ncbi:MAG: IPExxxVDY family protein [Bacteroidia bacterium]|nr:IPExxxVDY family protein [Bacteroidia bacterium]NNF30071.1 IPExxxVDY family protein [Flavobacteriaceae bacterium]MBT8274543.1 IPExxxVDY family protein [Bacteroidia bacterium]NNJ81869.1 IPExxxVDY family protein [Flavobacteriaceae bacterium]NNK53994.1 IPExxxVDY family protein [Flavobacteriaceae bacterium]